MILRKGMRISCKIGDTEIKDARVQVEGGWIYICQNERGGASCSDKMGYSCSWSVCREGEDAEGHSGVTNIRLHSSTAIEDIYQGAIIVCSDGDKRKVLGICGEAVFLSKRDEYTDAERFYYTISELKRAGYTLLPEEPIEEPSLIGEEVKVELKGKVWTAKIIG